MARVGEALSPKQAMSLAISEAKKGAGYTAPNPLVGAVILDSQSRFLASGYHARYGGPHAEIDAIEKVELSRLEGAQLYVTLEPCAHEGKTPSCAKRLSVLPLASVTYGIVDPNPLVLGAGLTIIESAGISVVHLKESEAECRELAEVFFVNQLQKRPFVGLKVATSLDGFMALKNGESQWITGEVARTHGHFLRATYDAILVGAGTFKTDNPSLNIRHPDYLGKTNKVVIMDNRGDLLSQLPGSKIGKHHEDQNIILVSPEVPSSQKSHILKCPYEIINYNCDSGIQLKPILSKLYNLGVSSVLIEGGAKTYGLFFDQELVDRLYLYMAPSLIGAANGRSWTQHILTSKLCDKRILENGQITPLGDDLLFSARPKFD